MNAMLYVRGRPFDYDLWEEQGADGWGWASIRPYFLKAENDERGASEHHGAGGPVNVQNQRSPRRMNADFIRAAEACGIPRCADYNSPEQDGVGMFQTFQKNGRRWSCADAYLRPAMKRDNLEVITHAQVQRLALDGRRATGVVYKRKGRERVARAGREVILSAGAFNSPQILMLSGIGPAGHLRDVGVPTAHDLPGVGQNLQDHPFLTMIWEMSRHPLALPGRRTEEPRGVAAAAVRSAVVHRRRVGRLRPHPAGAARGRHPVPRRRRLLREARRGGVRRPLLRDRADAADGQVTRLGEARERRTPATRRASSRTRSSIPTTCSR